MPTSCSHTTLYAHARTIGSQLSMFVLDVHAKEYIVVKVDGTSLYETHHGCSRIVPYDQEARTVVHTRSVVTGR